jgi:hypothetical protein
MKIIFSSDSMCTPALSRYCKVEPNQLKSRLNILPYWAKMNPISVLLYPTKQCYNKKCLQARMIQTAIELSHIDGEFAQITKLKKVNKFVFKYTQFNLFLKVI